MLSCVRLGLLSLLALTTALVSHGRAHATTYEVQIPGDQAWTDTGVDVEIGDQLTVVTHGTLSLQNGDPGWWVSPDFQTTSDPGQTCLGSSRLLIVRIGSGVCVEAGSRWAQTIESAGRLYLGINDTIHSDNVGAFTAYLTIERDGVYPQRLVELAEYWAPVVFQNSCPADGEAVSGRADWPVSLDFDGDWDATDNWDALATAPEAALTPTVYYHAVESEEHVFLQYYMFYPRDYEPSCAPDKRFDPTQEHENDLEGHLLIIGKDSSAHGVLYGMLAQAHGNLTGYPRSIESTGELGRLWTYEDPSLTNHRRAAVFMESGGHGTGDVTRAMGSSASGILVWFAEDASTGYQFLDQTGYIFAPASSTPHVPQFESGQMVGRYQLRPMAEIWEKRYEGLGEPFNDQQVVFESGSSSVTISRLRHEFQVALGHSSLNRAHAPWAWRDELLSLDQVGEFILDPLAAIQRLAPGLVNADPGHYTYNPGLIGNNLFSLEPTTPGQLLSYHSTRELRWTYEAANDRPETLGSGDTGLGLLRVYFVESDGTETALGAESPAAGSFSWTPSSSFSETELPVFGHLRVSISDAPGQWDIHGVETSTYLIIQSLVGSGSRAPQLFVDAYDRFDGEASGWDPVAPVLSEGPGEIQEFTTSGGETLIISLADGASEAYLTYGAIYQKYASMSRGNSILGYPVGDEGAAYDSPFGSTGRYVAFQAGTINHNITNGGATKEVHGPNYVKFQEMNYSLWMGFPISDVYPIDGGWRSDFEAGGYIFTDDQNITIAYSPYSPTALELVEVLTDEVLLQWADAAGFETGYRLLREEWSPWNKTATWTEIPLPADTQEYRDTSIITGMGYRYEVVGEYAGSTSPPTNQISVAGGATTWAVPGDCATIQCAIDMAFSGDVILVSPGAYVEDLTVDKAITLQSTNGSSSTVLQATGSGSSALVIQVDGVFLAGFDIAGGQRALEIRTNVESISVSGCVLRVGSSRPLILPPKLVPVVLPGVQLVPSFDGRFNGIELHRGVITEDMTWPVPPSGFVYYLLDGSPAIYLYAIEVSGPTNPTWTLLPDTIIKFSGDAGIRVGGADGPGSIIADGVIFTSYHDDAAGGDTNGDGADSPEAGDWRQLELNDTAIASFLNCEFRFGGYWGQPMLEVASPSVSFVNCKVLSANELGLSVSMGIPAISGCTFEDNNFGLGLTEGVSAQLVQNNQFLPQRGQHVLINPMAVPDVVLNNTFTASIDGTRNGIQIYKGVIGEDLTWPLPPSGFVYYMEDRQVSVALYPIEVSGPTNPTWTLNSGTVIKFNGDAGIQVGGDEGPGGIVADGVIFTSSHDDSAGGDTNGDGLHEPVAGTWRQIHLKDSASANFNNCQFRYGGYGYIPMVHSKATDVQMRGCSFSSAKEEGLRVSDGGTADIYFSSFLSNSQGIRVTYNGRPHVIACCFIGNTEYGVQVDLPRDGLGSVPIVGSWWGDVSGPSGEGPGLGDAVSAYVDFSPWELAPVCDSPTSIDPDLALPHRFTVSGPFPNPFNPSTTILLELPDSHRVSIVIYDISGRLVRTLIDEVVVAGRHEFRWDGSDVNARRVASGTYLCQVSTEGHQVTKRLVLLK